MIQENEKPLNLKNILLGHVEVLEKLENGGKFVWLLLVCMELLLGFGGMYLLNATKSSIIVQTENVVVISQWKIV